MLNTKGMTQNHKKIAPLIHLAYLKGLVFPFCFMFVLHFKCQLKQSIKNNTNKAFKEINLIKLK